ncbi:SCO4225 family membrane protein [Streptomyces sp. NPDC096132]|uniref:SCO4225 family membrane protein n=1 Tax=Streptomyces sp. NPDC096132 TaxID=3366075 RepID=UPI0038148AE9
MNATNRFRAALALAVNNWVSRAYLAAVALTAGFALYEDLFVSQADASMSYVAPMLLTAPLNMLFTMALAWIPTDAPFYLGIVIGGLVNAAVIGAAVRAIGRRRMSSVRPAPGA